MALGMFEGAGYTSGQTLLDAGDVLVMYSDGITEAEDAFDRSFDEGGLQSVIESPWSTAQELGWASFAAVERHVGARRLADDLTVLVLRPLLPVPELAVK
jgi:sigma-B regulation protein RsbU (phosphoserine phosphatase)